MDGKGPRGSLVVRSLNLPLAIDENARHFQLIIQKGKSADERARKRGDREAVLRGVSTGG